MNKFRSASLSKASALQRNKKILVGVLAYIVFCIFLYGCVVTTVISSTRFKNLLSFTSPFQQYSPAMHQENNNDTTVDIHLSDLKFGHTGEVLNHDDVTRETTTTVTTNFTTVAIGLGITSKTIKSLEHDKIVTNFQFFHTFLISFCKTASPGYSYSFYLAYDHVDGAFSNESFLNAFSQTFKNLIAKNCSENFTASIHFVQCDHSGKPVWAQNDAMIEAYLDNNEYYYRVNDDTLMQTPNWTRAFIEKLNSYKPKNVGVVGPNHSGGNTGILTYDFVHRTHLDIFGYYYPRTITDWWGDDWITEIYKPGHMTKLYHIRLAHTSQSGRRYNVNYSVRTGLTRYIKSGRDAIGRYIEHLNSTPSFNSSRVISMSLFGRDPLYTWGAIRNAQLTPIYFPGWKLRIYLPAPSTKDSLTNFNLNVPVRILKKLKQLGAELVHVTAAQQSSLPPGFWRYLVIDDPDVEYFLIRDANSRLSNRESLMVNNWLTNYSQSNTSRSSSHCIRDHISHVNTSVIEGLWGGSTREIRQIIKFSSIYNAITSYLSNNSMNSSVLPSDAKVSAKLTSRNFISEVLWPQISASSICHDTVSCRRWPKSVTLNTTREDYEYVGEKYDEHHLPINRTNWIKTEKGASIDMCL